MIKAAVIEKFNAELKFIKIKTPNLLYGQVLVKNKFASICGSQIFEINGGRRNKKFLPHMLGHESSGVVIAVGKGVKKVKKKDKVFLSWIINSGKDAQAPKFQKGINSGKIATFSTYSIVPENRINLIPKKIDFKTASLLGCALPTGAGIVFNQINVKRKNISVCIVGAGGIGVSALLALLFFGVNKKSITVIESNTLRVNFLKTFDQFKEINFQSKIHNKEKLSKYFYDYVIECSGSSRQIELSLDIIKNNGKVIFASHPHKNERLKIDPFDLILGKKIEGSWGGLVKFDRDIKYLVKIIKKYKNIHKIFFNKTYYFNAINIAIRDMRLGKVIRPLIKF
jgi:S-(hydroxymethyl)glutathione dehydrogenase/alcohol dehydrogenase